MKKIYVVIPAAGSGSRMRAFIPKLLLELAGVPIIVRTLRTILTLECVEQIVVTAPRDYLEQYERLLVAESRKVNVIIGGTSRQESVCKALDFIKADDDALVLIHDGARCFVTLDVLKRAIEGAVRFHAITVAVPVVDSIKRANGDKVVLESLDRSSLWSIQTPQVFEYGIIKKAHASKCDMSTDDASLVEKVFPVHIVLGDEKNFKVTTPFDLQVAKFLLQ